MANTSLRSAPKQVDGHAAAQIREFGRRRRSGLAREDASGNLLNEAVAVRLDKANRGSPDAPSVEDEPEVSAILRRKVEELEASRNKFSKFLSEEQKAHIATSPNTTDAILAVIDSASFDWCSRSASGPGMMSTIKDKFHKACASLDQHAGLLSMLPKESEYVSVFYGALNSIVAASVMHQAMATGLPMIVDEINAIVSDVAKKIELYPQAKRQMRRVLIELYTRIFDLLARLMKWYSSNKHYWKLLKKDCYSDFAQDLQDIRTWVDIVNRGAWNNLVLELRHAHSDNRESWEEERKMQLRFKQDMLGAADKFYEIQQNVTMRQAIQQEQLMLLSSEEYKESFANLVVERLARQFNIVGVSQTGVLDSMSGLTSQTLLSITAQNVSGRSLSPDKDYSPAAQSFLKAVKEDVQIANPNSNDIANRSGARSRSDVERYSRILDDWYPEGLMRPWPTTLVSTGQPELHESITVLITRWIRTDESQVLCIQLPHSQDNVSVGSDIASYVVSAAWQANHPIISHFCSLPRSVVANRSPQTVSLSEMMLSLIRQLIVLLPSALPEAVIGMDEARFSSLDGTLRTWTRMLDLLTDLSSLVTQSFLIVICGLECLDSQVTTPLIRELLGVIRKSIDNLDGSATQTVKVLLVTEGQARAVVPWLRRDEYAVYEGPQRSRHHSTSA